MDSAGISSEQEKDFFVRILRQLGANQDPYLSISDILKNTCDFFGLYSGFVYEADETQVFHLCEKYPHENAQFKDHFLLSDYLSGEEIEELVKHSGEIVYLNSRQTPLGTKFLELFSAKTLIMVPVILEQKNLIAFVGLMDRRHPVRLSKHAIDDADAVLSVLAWHIKIRIYQKRLESALESIQKMAENDPLTGLPNRRKFIADIMESLKRMKENGSSGYLLFMDLDDFKLTNDTLGHLAGDALLFNIGEFLYGERGTLGMPYRYGGDEFVIIAENTGPAALENIRDILLRRFNANWMLEEHAVPCSISIGAAPIPQGDMPFERLIQAADTAMYEVKKSGKHGFLMLEKHLDK
ncbi:hypothetical protein AGMMS49579_08760 [Spirochaetia bacterium]|nr:hypothetical protein AGMMS49579_08760 [Spirochaetia bacterium]